MLFLYNTYYLFLFYFFNICCPDILLCEKVEEIRYVLYNDRIKARSRIHNLDIYC